MKLRFVLASTLTILASASALAAQQVLVVAKTPGPGVFATQIQPAINAAVDGDVILVKAGTYNGFTVTAKSLSVVAESNAYVTVSGAEVTQLAAGQRVVLRDLYVAQGQISGFSITPLILIDNVGPIWVEGCTAYGDGSQYSAVGGARVNNCASVVFARSTLTGGSSGHMSPSQGGTGLSLTNSIATLFDTTCTGGSGQTSQPYDGATRGGIGARLIGGSLFASGSTFTGGHGGDGIPPVPPAQGGNGLVLEGPISALGCTMNGGTGGHSTAGPAPDGDPMQILAGGSLTTLAGTPRHFFVSSPVREGQPMVLVLGGPIGETAGVMFSTGPAAGAGLPLFDGVLPLDLANINAFNVGVVPASGTLLLLIDMPQLPASVQGATVFLQSFTQYFSQLHLGPVSTLVLLDSSL